MKEIFIFFNNFLFYDHYNLGRGIELKRLSDFISIVLSKREFICDDLCVKVLGIVDDISLRF